MTAPLTEFDTSTPAGKVLAAAGGLRQLATHLKVHKSWIWRWIQTKDKDKDGLEGRIPQSQHKKILKLAQLYGWPITAEDLIG